MGVNEWRAENRGLRTAWRTELRAEWRAEWRAESMTEDRFPATRT